MRKLVVRALYKDMPDEIKVDISAMNIGDAVHVFDLNYDNIEILDDPNSVMVLVRSPRAGAAFALPEDEIAEAEEGEEGVEGEEGEGAEEGAEEGVKEGAREGAKEGAKGREREGEAKARADEHKGPKEESGKGKNE
jgi:flagellar biosynthesis/type III secretory pathway protein FliH